MPTAALATPGRDPFDFWKNPSSAAEGQIVPWRRVARGDCCCCWCRCRRLFAAADNVMLLPPLPYAGFVPEWLVPPSRSPFVVAGCSRGLHIGVLPPLSCLEARLSRTTSCRGTLAPSVCRRTCAPVVWLAVGAKPGLLSLGRNSGDTFTLAVSSTPISEATGQCRGGGVGSGAGGERERLPAHLRRRTRAGRGGVGACCRYSFFLNGLDAWLYIFCLSLSEQQRRPHTILRLTPWVGCKHEELQQLISAAQHSTVLL